jgi:ABC-type multidrug transport system ATPase subunit
MSPTATAALNASQSHAVRTILSHVHDVASSGIALLQGPPGTGKSTTIACLVRAVVGMGGRVVVTAPSNKAVHVLARRLMHMLPADAPLVLLASKKRRKDVPADLVQLLPGTY